MKKFAKLVELEERQVLFMKSHRDEDDEDQEMPWLFVLWGCLWGTIALVINMVALNMSAGVGVLVSLFTTLFFLPLSFWGGMMVSRRGYIISKKFL